MSIQFVQEVQATFLTFLRGITPGARIAVVCHSDADGVPAGAIMSRTLRKEDFMVEPLVTGKGESAWSDTMRAKLAAVDPVAIFLLDLGSREGELLAGVPTLIIDHHRPIGQPAGSTLLTGYGQEPTPTAGLIAYWCAQALGKADDLLWLAAISLLSDIGDNAPFAELAEAKERYKPTPLRDATSLINAPRRSASGDAGPALSLLLEVNSPAEVTRGTRPEVELLKAAKAEVGVALAQAKMAAPKFSGRVAMLRIDTPCQVHPLIAQIWRTRLPKYMVLCANSGYLPGRVNFSMRTATTDNLLDFLAANAPIDSGEAYGYGHDQATGGSLSYAAWNSFVENLGFGDEAKVDA